jgi:drug/metabolite transporter (DMT)-like permease
VTVGRSPRVLVYLALTTQTLISAGTYLAAKRALVELPPLALVMIRNGGATACFLVLAALFMRPFLPPRAQWGRVLLLGLLGVPLNQGFFLTGLGQSTPSHAALLYTLTPLFVFLISWRMGTEKLQATKIVGLVIALGGAAIVVFERTGSNVNGGSAVGDLLILVAVLAWAGYTVLGKPLVSANGPIAATVWSLTVGTIMFLPMGLSSAAHVTFTGLTAPVWGALVFLVTLTSVVAYLCWYYALGSLEPSRVAVFTNLQPVATALASWMIRGDRVTPGLAVGGALVIGGVLVTMRKATPPARFPDVAAE